MLNWPVEPKNNIELSCAGLSRSKNNMSWPVELPSQLSSWEGQLAVVEPWLQDSRGFEYKWKTNHVYHTIFMDFLFRK